VRLIFGSKILLILIAGDCLRVLSQSLSFVAMPVVSVISLVEDMLFLLTRRKLIFSTRLFRPLSLILIGNGRDLLAILYALKSFKSVFKGKLVKLFTRSRNAAVISSKGSTSLRLRLKLNGSPGFSMCTLTPSVVSSILTTGTFLQLVSNSSHLFSVLFTVHRFASPFCYILFEVFVPRCVGSRRF